MELTAEEAEAINYYTALGYLRINASLRDEAGPDEETRKRIEALDSAIERSIISADTVVYRGLPAWFVPYLQWEGLGPGSVLYDDAFLSTSKLEEIGKLFGEWPDGMLMKIRLTKGSKGLDLTPYSQRPGEQEILLPRGTGLRILSYNADARVLEAEVTNG